MFKSLFAYQKHYFIMRAVADQYDLNDIFFKNKDYCLMFNNDGMLRLSHKKDILSTLVLFIISNRLRPILKWYSI